MEIKKPGVIQSGLACALIFLFALTCASPLAGQRGDAITTEVIWSAEIPTDLQIRGAHISKEGEVLVWGVTASGETLIRYQGGERRVVPLEEDVLIAGAASFDDQLIILDSTRGAESMAFDHTGSLLSRSQMSVPGGLISGVWTGDHWVVLAHEEEPTQFTVHSRGGIAWDAVLDAEIGLESRVWLSASGQRSYVSTASEPYLVFEVDDPDPTGGSEHLSPTFSGGVPSGEPGRWIALPALFLGEEEGILRTFVDQTSERRGFLRFGSDGAILSTTFIEAPLAFIAATSAEEGSYLLGTLRVSGPELVLFRWRCSPR